ncbi:MAG: hypothetical protein C0506_02725 [Anaerolinea sp.]|nr:hypothetical protein [Anaerolinea sp.]
MDAKAELQALIDQMSEDEVLHLTDLINNKNDPDELTPEEMADVLEALAEYERGETVTFEEVKAKYGW